MTARFIDMTTRLRLSRLVLAALLAAPLLGMAGTSGIAARKPTAPASMPAPQPVISSEGILAVVNGDVVTQGDVEARAKLFAMLNGITLSPDDMQRLAPQIVQQLIDERLRLQEAQSRQIAVPDADIAAQIDDMNKRDNGNLRNALAANGISLRTLVDQLRAQIAWTQVLRQEIGAKAQVTPAEVDQRMAVEKAASGQPEYEVAEIFVPIGSDGFFIEGSEKARFDQQPVEACATVSACLEVYRLTEESQWLDETRRVFSWFLGKNDLQVPLYDAVTGGCRDGLHPDRINENQGAESTLSFLMALLEMREAKVTNVQERQLEMSASS